MPYKDKEKQLETTRERVRRYRDKQKGVTLSGVTEQGVTKDYPAIIYALTDPVKRKKLEKVCQSLKIRKQDKNVYYGYSGLSGVPFDVIGDLLEATR